MTKILAIDLGTTFFKLTLFDRTGRLCESHRIAPAVVRPKTGWMELPAAAMEEAIAGGIRELGNRPGGGLADVEAVTFATQTNSFVLLGEDGRPLTPVILWPDARGAELEAELQEQYAAAEAGAITGVPQLGCQFMVAKLLWLRQHRPEIWRRMDRIALMSDYLTLLLTGEHVTEAGAAGLTGLVDIHRCRWSTEILARFGLGERRLSAIARAGTDLGPIRPSAADRFGLPRSCRFIVGCLDQYAGAIGVGNVEPGMISETTGTALATVRCADRFSERLGPAVFQGPAFRKGLYWRMAFGDVSANYLQWYRDQLSDQPEFERLTALAEPIEPGAAGLRLRTGAGLTVVEKVFDGLTSRHGAAIWFVASWRRWPGRWPIRRQSSARVRCLLKSVAPAAPPVATYGCKSRPTCWVQPRPPRPVASRRVWVRPSWPMRRSVDLTCRRLLGNGCR